MYELQKGLFSMRFYLILTLAYIIVTLTACGGGSSSSSSASFSTAQPTLSYSSTKLFDFTWTDVSGGEFYRVLENQDSNSGFIQVGADILAGTESFSLSVPLYKRLNARYILQTCDASQCLDSNEISVTGNLNDNVGYIKAGNPSSGDNFGGVVSLSDDGSTLAVGAYSEDSSAIGINGTDSDSAAPTSGAVYIFVRENSKWSQQAFIKASNAEAYDWFGFSLSLSNNGNTLVVGARLEDSAGRGVNAVQTDNNASGSGAAYVFVRSGASWSQNAYLKASNADADDNFGISVAISGDGSTIAVGADEESSRSTGINGDEANNGWSNAGAVYVFSSNGASWQQQAYVKASNTLTAGANFFGEAVSLSDDGNMLAVGASGDSSAAIGINGDESDTSASFSGAAFVFTRTGTTWSQQAYIKASNTEAQDNFGAQITLSGDGSTLAVSADLEDSASIGIDGEQSNNSATSSGAVYTYRRTNNQWSQEAYIKASNTGIADYFATAISLNYDGNLLAVGSINEDSNSLGIGGDEQSNTSSNTGAVYVYERTDGSWSQLAYVKSNNTGANDWFGVAVSLSDDGDTLAVGAQLEDGAGISLGDNEAGSAGAAYLY